MRHSMKAKIFDTFSLGYLLLMSLVAVLRPEEEQLLDLKQNFIVALICLALGFVLTLILEKLKKKTLGVLIFEPPHKKALGNRGGFFTSVWGWELIILFVMTFMASIVVTEFSFYELTDPKGLDGAMRIFGALFTPNFSILPQGILAIMQTIFMAFLATVIAVPISFVLSFFCASNVMNKSTLGSFVYTILRIVMNVTRSI